MAFWSLSFSVCKAWVTSTCSLIETPPPGAETQAPSSGTAGCASFPPTVLGTSPHKAGLLVTGEDEEEGRKKREGRGGEEGEKG